MTTADIRTFADGLSEERAEIVAGLLHSGCTTARRRQPSDTAIGLWLRGVHLLIRAVGFGRALRVLSLAAPDYARADPAAAEDVERLKRAVRSHGHRSWFVNGDCKAEAMTAFLLLRRRGLRAVLHVGVREHPFALHAWTSSACASPTPIRAGTRSLRSSRSAAEGSDVEALRLEWDGGVPQLWTADSMARQGLVTTVSSRAGTAVVTGWVGSVRERVAGARGLLDGWAGRKRHRLCRPVTTRPSWCAATASC
ncbi:lasso peptide biosynthesis B2 protein [Streptomyces sp. INA 01156]